MQIDTPTKRSWLRARYRLIPGTYATLLAALNAGNDSAASVSSAGTGTVVEVSANGRTTRLQSPTEFSTTSQESARAWADLLDRYDSSKAALIAAGTAAPTDAQIYAQMLAELVPAYESTPDFSNLYANRC